MTDRELRRVVQGGWNLTVEAASADEAEKLAVRQMIGEDSGAGDDFEDTDPAEDFPGLLNASGAVPGYARTLRGPHWAVSDENVINHDTVREQTGEDA